MKVTKYTCDLLVTTPWKCMRKRRYISVHYYHMYQAWGSGQLQA